MGLRDRLRDLVRRAPPPPAGARPAPPPPPSPRGRAPAIGLRAPIRVDVAPPGMRVVRGVDERVGPDEAVVVVAADPLDAAAVAEILAARGGRRVHWEGGA